jgi:ABC-2 type transport system permease protein
VSTTTAAARRDAPPPLREVRGPSALGGGAARFANLARTLAITDFRTRYLDTAFGYVWSLARPLLTFAVLYTVFSKVIRFGNSPYYAQGLLICLMLFTFFQEVTFQALPCVVVQEGLVRKMQFPRLVIPLSVVLTGLFNLCLNLLATFVIILATGVSPRLGWLALPLLCVWLLAVTAGFALLLPALYIRFRDVSQIWGVFALMLLYASPVIYPVSFLVNAPHALHALLYVNPLAPILIEARHLVVGGVDAQSVLEATGSWWGFIGPALVGAAVCVAGFVLFSRSARYAAEEL